MAKSEGYEVLVPELTVHKAVGILKDPITDKEIGVQQGQGKIYLQGEVIPAGDVSPLLLAALENEDHPSHDSVCKKLAKAGTNEASVNTGARLGLPFEGYDDMDEAEIVAAMRVLPSRAISAVKRYESLREDPRDLIVNYSVGHGESPTDRLKGRVGSKRGPAAEGKKASNLTTREVSEDDVQLGEGITGSVGDVPIPHGSIKEAAGEDEADDKPKPRRSRRTRSSSQGSKK